MKSQTLKVIAFIELILGIWGSIAVGVILSNTLLFDVTISLIVSLSLTMSVIILFIILYALYSILSNVEAIRETKTDKNSATLSNQTTNNLKKQVNSKITIKNAKAQSPEAKFAERYYWVCDNCLELNNKKSTVCSKCGTKKTEEIIENEDIRPEVLAVESWGKPSEMSQEVYDAVLSLLDDMDEYTANNMSTELFKECVNKAYKVVKGQCNSNSSAVDDYFKVELQKIISEQCIAVEEVEVHKEKFLKKLNFEK